MHEEEIHSTAGRDVHFCNTTMCVLWAEEMERQTDLIISFNIISPPQGAWNRDLNLI